jgi:hypothetical protein
MLLSDVMDELAARLDVIDGLRVHAFPADNVNVPQAVVTYPETLTFDETYGRGSDRLTIPVVVLVGKASDRASRDQLAAYADGSGVKSIKSAIESASYLNLASGTAKATTPDHADFATNVVDARILVAPADWTPSGFGMHLFGQENNAPIGSQDKAWTLSVHPDGIPRMAIYPDGTDNSIIGLDAGVATGFTDGTKHWLRSRFIGDLFNLGTTRVWDYFTAEYDGTLTPTWTQLGTQRLESGAVTIHNSAQPLQINGPIFPTTGKVWYAELRNAADVIVANPDFRGLPVGTTSFKDSTGKVWTLGGTAAVVSDPEASPTYTSFDSARVTGVEFDVLSVAGVEHVAATFSIDVFGNGA